MGAAARVPARSADPLPGGPDTVLILDNTSTFGGAINSLAHMLKAIDRGRYAPVVVTGQPPEFLRDLLPGVVAHHCELRQPWIDDAVYSRIRALPLFRFRTADRALGLSRFAYWLLRVTLPEAVRYYRIGRRHGARLVHLNNDIQSQLAGILAARMLRVPCVAHARAFQPSHPLVRAYARWIDHHIAISTPVRESILALGVGPERVSLVFDGVDLDEFREAEAPGPVRDELGIPRGAKVFGIFGRIVPWKGIREFVLAARQVLEAEPDAFALIVGDRSDGDPAYYDEVVRLVGELGLRDRLLLAGYRRDVARVMSAVDVVVHASVEAEPFGMVVIEGMGVGKPVVATRAGGPLDIVLDGRTGLLVEPGDPEEMGRAILRLLRDPRDAAAMGRRGKARARELFSKERYAREVEAVYARLTRWRGAAGPATAEAPAALRSGQPA